MGQELTSPIKCSGDENIKQERDNEKNISSRDSGFIPKYIRPESRERSQNSILTFYPEEHSPEQSKRSSYQASINELYQDQKINAMNKSPVRMNKFNQEDDSQYYDQIKRSQPNSTNGQYPNAKLQYSPNSSSFNKTQANQNKSISPLDKMVEELEIKKKNNKELIDGGYPRESSPTKLQMIQEILSTQNNDQNKYKKDQKKKTPEQVDQLVKKLLERGEEIKLKQMILNEEIQSKEMSECTFQPSLEKSSNLYNSGMFNSRNYDQNAQHESFIQRQDNYLPHYEQQNPLYQQQRGSPIKDELKQNYMSNPEWQQQQNIYEQQLQQQQQYQQQQQIIQTTKKPEQSKSSLQNINGQQPKSYQTSPKGKNTNNIPIQKQKQQSPNKVQWKDASPQSNQKRQNPTNQIVKNSASSAKNNQKIEESQPSNNLRQMLRSHQSYQPNQTNQKQFQKKDENNDSNNNSNNNSARQSQLKDANNNSSNILPQNQNNFKRSQSPQQKNTSSNHYSPKRQNQNQILNSNKQAQVSPKNQNLQNQQYQSQQQQQYQSQQNNQRFTQGNEDPNYYSNTPYSSTNSKSSQTQFASNKATPTINLTITPNTTNNSAQRPYYSKLGNDDPNNKSNQQEQFHPDMEEFQIKQKNYKVDQSTASLNPNNNSLNNRSRSWKQFLDDQNRFIDSRELNIQHSRVNIESTTTAEFVYQPELTKKTKQLAESKTGNDSDVFLRLNNQITESIKQKQYNAPDQKTPERTRDGSMNRQCLSPELQNQLINRLYDDASVRKEKNKKLAQELQASEVYGQPPLMAQRMNEYCLAQKFIKDFEDELSQVVNAEVVPHHYQLNYYQVQEIAKRLRFLSDKDAVDSQNFVEERTLMNDLWVIMNGQIYNGIRSRNLLLFFFALHGLNIDLPIITNEILNNSVYYQNVSATKINIKITDIKPADRLYPDSEQLNTFGYGNPNAKSQTLLPSFNNMSSNNLSTQKLSQSGLKQTQTPNQYLVSSNMSKGEYHPFTAGSNAVLTPRGSGAHLNQNSDLLQQTSNFNFQPTGKNLQIGTFDQIQNWSITPNDIKQIQNHFMLWYLNRLHSTKNKDKQYYDYLQQQENNQGLQKSQSFISLYKNKNTDELANNHRQRMILAAEYADVPIQNRDSVADIQTANKIAKQKMNEQIKQQKQDIEISKCTFHPETYSTRSKSPIRDIQSKTVYESLYDQRKSRPKIEKTTLDIEYENQCDECTFQPQINQGTTYRQQTQPQAAPYIRNADTAIKRMKQGQQEREYKEKSKERGYEFPKRPKSLLPNKDGQKSPISQNKQNKAAQQEKQDLNTQSKNSHNSNGQYNNTHGNGSKLQSSQNNEKPIMLFVDVNLGGDIMQRIVVRDGDQPEILADDFIQFHQLPSDIRPKLIDLLTQQINSFLSQVVEDHRESEY